MNIKSKFIRKSQYYEKVLQTPTHFMRQKFLIVEEEMNNFTFSHFAENIFLKVSATSFYEEKV